MTPVGINVLQELSFTQAVWPNKRRCPVPYVEYWKVGVLWESRTSTVRGFEVQGHRQGFGILKIVRTIRFEGRLEVRGGLVGKSSWQTAGPAQGRPDQQGKQNKPVCQ